jgi:imidazolonepropionase-like amidohydrolase
MEVLMATHFTRRDLAKLAGLAALAGSTIPQRPFAQTPEPPSGAVVAFENVRVFDGISGQLSGPSNVLVRGNTIERISTAPIPIDRRADARIVAGGGRTLMPGLVDAHTHIMFAGISQLTALTSDIGFLNVAVTKAATDMLMRGFTSIRDLGGPVFGLKRGIDEGLVVGPRIWPSGAFISQSGGHGDFRIPNELPAPPGSSSYPERAGASMIADNPDAVRQCVREQLALGASQIKLMAGGGVASP